MKHKEYMKIAQQIGESSKCLSRKVGAILVKNGSIISTGYNGPAKHIPHCTHRDETGKYHKFIVNDVCPRRLMNFPSGQGMNYCPAVHAEENAIVNAAKAGHSTDGSTMYLYCDYIPCSVCMGSIINAGIKEVIVLQYKEYPEVLSSVLMAKQGGVKIKVLSEDLNG